MACNSTLGNLPNEYWSNVLGSLMCIATISATLENLLVLVVLSKYSVLKTTSNKILASLAMADFLTGATVAPLHAVQYLSEDVRQNCVVEQMRRYISTALIGASTLSLGFISYDRCLHLVKLQKYKMRLRFLYTVLLVCWLVPILIPFLRKISNSEQIYSATILTVGTINLLTILISYLAVILALHQYSRRCGTGFHQSAVENERRAGVTVLIVITLYISMLVPIFIHHGLNLTNSFDEKFLAITYSVAQCLAILNSSVNPLIYCYRTPVLKKFTRTLFKDVRKMLTWKRAHEEKQDTLTVESLL